MTDWHGIPSEYRSRVVTGDARTLAKALPDNSVDLIFTDPPYPREYLHLYEWLAEEAARVLRPGGFLLAYAGGSHKDDVMAHCRRSLSYFWDFVTLDGHTTILWGKRINAGYKSILAYVKGEGLPRLVTQSVWRGSGQDKRFHAWGQDESTARYYIECFSKPGDIVLDPFCGGGTTPYVCEQLGRRWVAYEAEAVTADVARDRLTTVQMPLLGPEDEQARMELIA